MKHLIALLLCISTTAWAEPDRGSPLPDTVAPGGRVPSPDIVAAREQARGREWRLCWCWRAPGDTTEHTCQRRLVVWSCWDSLGCREPKKKGSPEEQRCLRLQQGEGSTPRHGS